MNNITAANELIKIANNLIVKKYENFGVKGSAAMIISEIIDKGKSDGWQGGSKQMFEKVKRELSKFNVYYVNDFYGEWALKR